MTEVAFEKGEDIQPKLPGQALGWRVLVRPYEPPEMHGSLAIPEETQESEKYLTYVGQVIHMGSECYKAVTRSGIDLSKIDPKPKVGDWVIYGTYGGQRIKMKSGIEYLLMNDDTLMMVVDDPSEFRAYI